jgi:hypothetical protein
MKMITEFWKVSPCNSVDRYKCNKLHGVTFQNTIIIIIVIMKASDLVSDKSKCVPMLN